MIASLGLGRALRQRAGGTIRNPYAITACRDVDMLLFSRIISRPADGQVTAGQAEIGLHDMLGAVQRCGRCGGVDAHRNLDDIPAGCAYCQGVRLDADPVTIHRLLGPARRRTIGIRAVRSHPDPVSVEILQEELVVISGYDQPSGFRARELHSTHDNAARATSQCAGGPGHATDLHVAMALLRRRCCIR
jgi:hypothetical protein